MRQPSPGGATQGLAEPGIGGLVLGVVPGRDQPIEDLPGRHWQVRVKFPQDVIHLRERILVAMRGRQGAKPRGRGRVAAFTCIVATRWRCRGGGC